MEENIAIRKKTFLKVFFLAVKSSLIIVLYFFFQDFIVNRNIKGNYWENYVHGAPIAKKKLNEILKFT